MVDHFNAFKYRAAINAALQACRSDAFTGDLVVMIWKTTPRVRIDFYRLPHGGQIVARSPANLIATLRYRVVAGAGSLVDG